MNILLAASPSFIKDDVLQKRYAELKQRCPTASLHCITQKHFTKMLTKLGPIEVHVRDFAAWAGAATTKAYEAILDRMNGVIVFWDGESKPEGNLIRWCGEKGIRVDVVRFESLKQELERTKPPKGEKRKPKVILEMPVWCKEKYIAAHKEKQERETPAAIKDHGYAKTQIPPGTTNGLTKFLCNYFNWKGHHLERINNGGVQRGDTWTKGSGTNGTSDTSGHFNRVGNFAIPIKPEVKTGRDKLSDDQIKFADKMQRTGAVSCVITCFEDVFKLYEYLETL